MHPLQPTSRAMSRLSSFFTTRLNASTTLAALASDSTVLASRGVRTRATDMSRVFKRGLDSPKWDKAAHLPLPVQASSPSTVLATRKSQAALKAAEQAASADGANQPTQFYAITLKRSSIGMPQKIKDLIENDLGIKKRLRTVIYPVNPSIAGKILKIKEMVQVDLLDKLPYGAVKVSHEQLGHYVVPRRLRNGGQPLVGYKKVGSML